MNTKTMTVALYLTLLVSASAAVVTEQKGSAKGRAQDSGELAGRQSSRDSLHQWRGLDRNGDGMIARDEWRGNATSCSQLDSNRDGVLTSAGMAVRQKASYVDRSGDVLWNGGGGWEASNWTRMDVNRNGVISRSEWRGTTFQFNRLDRNDDGVIAASETW